MERQRDKNRNGTAFFIRKEFAFKTRLQRHNPNHPLDGIMYLISFCFVTQEKKSSNTRAKIHSSLAARISLPFVANLF